MSARRRGEAPDLLRAGGPVLGAFPPLRTAAEAADLRLSDEQVERFERDGFVGPVPVLDAACLAGLRAAVDACRRDLDRLEPRLYEVERAHRAAPDAVVCHFLGGWLVDPWLHDLVFAPRLAVPCAQLLGRRALRLWHDQVFFKPPRHRGAVPWHQDYSYWTRTEPAAHITANVMLDDADEDSGCLEFVPGSHRWGLLPPVSFDAPRDAVKAHLDPAQRAAFRPVAVPVPAGMATLHHSHTLHGSAGNRSDRPRRALVVNYMATDTRCASDEPLLRGVPRVERGAVVEGAHFPIVLDLDVFG